MTVHAFHQLDVFTDRPLTGNALAVFPQAEGIDPATMQGLAREMNLSETTFVLPSANATRRVRFFTPRKEIPLAGHPTIGTWWLLAELGLLADLPEDGSMEVTQETGRGVLPVTLTFAGGRVRSAVMTQATPEFLTVVRDGDGLARALGAAPGAVARTPAPEVVSTALPQLMVPLVSPEALTALPSGGAGGALAALLRRFDTDCAMCYAPPDDGRVRCRMFAPGLGVPEDPATGSAAGALGAHLVRRGVIEPHDGSASIVVEQGVEIGHPSRIEVELDVAPDGAIQAVRVGGAAVRVIRGEVTL